MQIERHTLVPGTPERAFALVEDLSEYPAWMQLVHEVAEAPADDGAAAWSVELQAQVGPFARSKRLRMVRVVHETPQRVVFERAELDGRQHSPWILEVTLDARPPSTAITMTLTYGGNLWTGAVLQRELDEHVERGAAALRSLLEVKS